MRFAYSRRNRPIKLHKNTLIKLAIIAAVFIIAPFAAPFALEFVLMADLLGLEALLLFLLLQSRHLLNTVMSRLSTWIDDVLASLTLLTSLYIFQPKIFVPHAIGSSAIVLFACSLSFALALWIPPLLLSSNGFF